METVTDQKIDKKYQKFGKVTQRLEH